MSGEMISVLSLETAYAYNTIEGVVVVQDQFN